MEQAYRLEAGCGYTFFWIDRPSDQPRTAAVCIAIKNSVILKFESLPRHERATYDAEDKAEGKPATKNTFVSVYAPTLTNDDIVKEQFYEELDKVIRNTSASDKHLVVGDFNARVRSNASNWKGVFGLHGVGKENSNGVLLLSKCAQHQLAITGTLFRQKDKYKTTR